MAAESLALSCYGAAIRVVDTAGMGVCESLRANRPAWFARENRDPVAATFLVLPRGAHGYSVERDGVERLRIPSPGEVIRWIGSELDRALAEQARLALFVHAGVVGWRGYAIVVPGRSATGKSMLVRELVRRGASYFSDEYAVFDDRGLVHSYARTLTLREEARRSQPSRIDRPVEDGPPDPLPVALLVSTVHRPGVPWRLEVLCGTRAVLPVVDNAVLARAQGARTLRLAARLAPAVVTLQGPRPDAEAVAPKLLDLLDEALETSSEIGGKDGPLLAVARSKLTVSPATSTPELRGARYVRIEDFLTPAEHDRLLAYAMASEAQYEESHVMGSDGQSQLDRAFRRSRTLFRLEDTIWESIARRLRRTLAHVRAELGLPWFPLDHIERQLTAHAEGGHFRAHTDNGRSEVAARRVTCVYYFHRTPRRFTGGELRTKSSVCRRSLRRRSAVLDLAWRLSAGRSVGSRGGDARRARPEQCRQPGPRIGPGVAPGTFDENACYRLATLWQGTGKSLGIGPTDGNRITVRLIPTADDPGQHGQLTPLPGGHDRLTTRRLGEGISLEGFEDDRGRDLVLRPSARRPGDGWRIVAAGGGHYRLVPGRLGDGWSLDIANDGRANNRPVLAPTGNYSGQSWRISRLP